MDGGRGGVGRGGGNVGCTGSGVNNRVEGGTAITGRTARVAFLAAVIRAVLLLVCTATRAISTRGR